MRRSPGEYLALAVNTLLRTGAANVGGRVRPAGRTLLERSVALATSSPLGAGNARYRIGGAEGPVDTVFPGVFRRAAVEAAGGWDETLRRNEDYELNWRLRERGGTVWFDPGLVVHYRPRGSFRALARQYFGYGRWKAVVLARHPRSVRARQLAAPLLVAALAASAGLFAATAPAAPNAPVAGMLRVVAAAIPLSYLVVLTASSAAIGLRRRRAEALLVPAVAAVIHLAFGIGFFAGLPAAVRGAYTRRARGNRRATDDPRVVPRPGDGRA